MIATLIGIPLIDTFVGLMVALIILKSAVELALEMVRSAKGAELDLTRAAREALNFQGNYILKHVNMDDYKVDDQQIEAAIQEIFNKSWLKTKGNKLYLTQAGRQASRKYTRLMHKFS